MSATGAERYEELRARAPLGGAGALQHRRGRVRQASRAGRAGDGPGALRRRGARAALGRAAGPRQPGGARCSRRSASSAATASRSCCRRRRRRRRSSSRTWKLGAILLVDVGALRRRGHRAPAARLRAARLLVTDAANAPRFDRRAWAPRRARARRARRSTARRATFVTRRHRRRRPGAALLHLGHDRPREGHRARAPLPARPRGVRLLPRGAGRRALPRHGRVGVGGRASARCSGPWRLGAVQCVYQREGGFDPHRQLDFLSPPPGHATCSRRRRRCAR